MPLGDPEEIDAILTSYKMGLEEGERQTVEKIVAWVRVKYVSVIAEAIISDIEDGEWK